LAPPDPPHVRARHSRTIWPGDRAGEPVLHVDSSALSVKAGQPHPATFTPGPKLGEGLDETIDILQQLCDEQHLAEPITVCRAKAEIAH
jgi:hypothetical protein